jgi:putative phosphoribosyl transferase
MQMEKGCKQQAGQEADVSLFKDRRDAGRQLAERMVEYADRDDTVVLGLPRGGVPVAYEVAQAIHAPLDIFIVRKLGVPGHEELAMGAIASGGVRVLNDDVVRGLRIPEDVIDAVAERQWQELRRREQTYRGDRDRIPLAGKTAILIDDGLATGSSMRAAVEGLRKQDPKEIVVAVPTAAIETCAMFRDLVEDVICAHTPRPFYGVGAWYEDFAQTTDEEVRDLLARAEQEVGR